MKFIIPILFIAAVSANAQQLQTQGQRQRLNNLNNNANLNAFNPVNNNSVTGVNRNVNRNTSQAAANIKDSGNSQNSIRNSIRNSVKNQAKGGNASGGAVSITDNSSSTTMAPTIPSFIMTVDYATWKASRKTKKGATISQFDPRSAQPAAVTAPIDAKGRYDAFLRDQGINPQTIGHATLIAGKMMVPTAHQVYASQNQRGGDKVAAK
jgi:hypothetical protein